MALSESPAEVLPGLEESDSEDEIVELVPGEEVVGGEGGMKLITLSLPPLRGNPLLYGTMIGEGIS